MHWVLMGIVQPVLRYLGRNIFLITTCKGLKFSEKNVYLTISEVHLNSAVWTTFHAEEVCL